MSADRSWLRPSALPKLALCAHYRSDAVAGEAAQRGTLLDTWFRDAILNQSRLNGLGEDAEAVNWALDTAWALAGGREGLDGTEKYNQIECMGLTGTADLLCENAGWSADLKTGQKRNYREQQAAYALGFMDRYFVDEWTVYLLFCDQQEVETLRFTRAEAEATVRGVLARVNDPELPPQLNDYCGWCAQRYSCPVRRESLGLVPFDTAALKLEDAPSEQLREFVLRAATVEDFRERARDILKERCLGGEKIAGVSMSSRRGTRLVPHTVVELHLRELGSADVLSAYGSISEAKLLEIWKRKLPGRPFPAEKVQEMPGSTFMRVGRPKAQLADK